jgi:hypothetical protein
VRADADHVLWRTILDPIDAALSALSRFMLESTMQQGKPVLLSVARLPDFLTGRLREAFVFHDRLHESDPAKFDSIAPSIRGIVSSGEGRVSRELLGRLPVLEIISVFGVGYDGVDLCHSRTRRASHEYPGSSDR